MHDFPCQSIRSMVDLAATELNLEGMRDNMTGGQNGQHVMNVMQIWMEYSNRR